MLDILKNHLITHRLQITHHVLATLAAVFSRVSILLISFLNIGRMSGEEFGVFVLLLFIANMVSALVSCGGDLWLNRFSRSHHAKKKQIPIVSLFYLKTSICLAGIAVLVALLIISFGSPFFKGYELAIIFALLWAACQGLLETLLAILRTTNDISRFFIVRDFFTPLSLILGIVLFKVTEAGQFFLMAFLIWLASLLFIVQHCYRNNFFQFLKKRSLEWSRYKQLRMGLIKYTLGLISNNLIARLSNGIDTLLLAKVLPVQWAGRYRFSSHFSNAFIVVQHFVFLALPWQLRSSPKTVQYRQSLLMVSAIPALIILILLVKPTIGFLVKDFSNPEMLVDLFKVFLMIRFSEIMWGPQHEILISHNQVKWDTFSNLMGFLATVLFFCGGYFLLGLQAISAGVIGAGSGSLATQLTRFLVVKHYEADYEVDRGDGVKKKVEGGVAREDKFVGLPYVPYLPLLIVIGACIWYLSK